MQSSIKFITYTLAIFISLCLLTKVSCIDEEILDLEALGHPHTCFYPSNSEDANPTFDTDDQFQIHDKSQNSRYSYMSGRWTSFAVTSALGTAPGTPLTLTWSIVPDGMAIPGNSGEPAATSNLRSFMTGIFGSQAAYLAMFNQSFQAWQGISGVSYRYEPNDDGATMFTTSGKVGVRGDIRISGHPIDGANNVLAYTYSPNSGDMVIDTGDSFFTNNKNWVWQVVAHELGHALGLAHTCPMSQTKLMEPYFSTKFSGPQIDDILAAQQYYGDAYEANNQFSTSSYLGQVSAGSSVSVKTVSLHAASDLDFYSFVPSSTGTVSAVVYPNGQTYTVGAVGSGGVANSCSGTFPTVNTLQIFTLNLAIYDSSQNLLGSASSGGLGSAQSLSVQVTAGKTYYVKVSTASTASGSVTVQMYNMTISSAVSNVVTPSSAPVTPSSAPVTPSSSPSNSPAASASHSHVPLSATASRSYSPSHSRAPIAVSHSPSHSRSRRPIFGKKEEMPEAETTSTNKEEELPVPVMQIDVHPFSGAETETQPTMQVDVHPPPAEGDQSEPVVQIFPHVPAQDSTEENSQ